TAPRPRGGSRQALPLLRTGPAFGEGTPHCRRAVPGGHGRPGTSRTRCGRRRWPQLENALFAGQGVCPGWAPSQVWSPRRAVTSLVGVAPVNVSKDLDGDDQPRLAALWQVDGRVGASGTLVHLRPTRACTPTPEARTGRASPLS